MNKLEGKIAVITGGNSGRKFRLHQLPRGSADVFSGGTTLLCTKPLTHA
jgi:hypothetical protein